MGSTDDGIEPGKRIADVSDLLGIPIPTIRSWERRYGFPTPARTEGSHRRYRPVDVEGLRRLRDLIMRGHSSGEAVALLQSRGGAGDPRHVDLRGAVVGAAMRLDPTALRDALDASADRLGVDVSIRDVILPSMHEMGSRWKTGSCDVAHEHLASEGVRSWLSGQASMALTSARKGAVVMGCGPNDLHTIGLEAFAVILARRGWACRVLGAMTPVASFAAAVRSTGAVAAVVTAQRNVTRRSAVGSIHAISEIRRVKVFFAGDAFSSPSVRSGVPGVYLGDDVLAAADTFDAALRGRARSTRTSKTGAG